MKNDSSRRQGGACVALAGMLVATLLSADFIWAGEAPPREPAQLNAGTLFICGGGWLSEDLLTEFIDLAGGKQARLVVVSTASVFADTPDIEYRLRYWRDMSLQSFHVLHTRSRETANDPEFCAPLRNATAVWFMGGTQSWITDVYLGTLAETEFHNVLQRGGVVGGTSAGAAIMSRVMIRRGNPEPEVGEGFGFLPGAVVDQHFLKRSRRDRLLRVLEAHPGLVGLGIDEGTALVVQGRNLKVLGESEVVACLAASSNRPARTESLRPGTDSDLTAFSRAALSRAQGAPIAAAEPIPQNSPGTLVMAGGGELPVQAIERFLKAAGGATAKIVVVSTAQGDEMPPDKDVLNWLVRAGAQNVEHIHPRTRTEANDPKTLDLLRQAQGIWFTGGRQWRLVDVFLDTPAERILHGILHRGGVIGGTSAGATIQGGYLVRGNPLDNSEIIAEGYDRGLGFLPGVAIDQHFTERHRFDDMATLKKTYPQLTGIGIDEGTALIVQGSAAEVVGREHVTIFDQQGSPEEAATRVQLLQAGDRYDFTAHRPVLASTTATVVSPNSAVSISTEAGSDEPKPAPVQ